MYASRALSKTERRYAQVEKEALAITWSCEKFSDYILGRHFEIETDHKPLVPLMSSKHLNDLPPRVLRFRPRMAKFDYEIRHVPGKYLYTADTLSRYTIPELESTHWKKKWSHTWELSHSFVSPLLRSVCKSTARHKRRIRIVYR